MGMEDYQVNGMGYEKPASEQRLDYLNANNFGHVVLRNLVNCRVCGRQACSLTEVVGESIGGFIEVVRTIRPSACRYSEI